jgi:IS5 family transposase
MVGSVQHQPTLFYAAFGAQASLIKDDLLEPLDALLDDEALVDLVRQSLGSRRPRSRTTGRRGIAPDRLLRCCVLKHVKGWTLRELERELRSNLAYRRFTRFDSDPIPRHSTFSRCFAALGAQTELIHARVVGKACEQKVARGRKLRTDSTVTESNIHYPTESTLLQDGIRVLTRSLSRVAEQCAGNALKVVNHARAAKRRVIEIHRAARVQTEAGRSRLRDGYRRLIGLARGVVRQAEGVMEAVATGTLPVVGDLGQAIGIEAQLSHFVPLVRKVISQTQARVFGGDTHVPGKVLSLFEEHTQAIRKGKAHRPTEFGRLVRIDEVENGIVSHYEVKKGNPADVNDFVPAVEKHREVFGHAPDLATGDRGYHSAENERKAYALGCKRVALPARGRLSESRARLQKERWFQRALRWRTPIEGRIGTLKHRFGMARACYKGAAGFQRAVGWSVIANNLVSIARTLARRQREGKKDARVRPAA